MNKSEKKAFVQFFKQVALESGAVVIARYSGLTAADMGALREQMADESSGAGGAKVIKNRLAKIALQGTEMSALSDLLKGPVVLGYSRDPLAAPKVFSSFSKENEKLEILGGALGVVSLDSERVFALAAMPSLDVLRGKIVGVLKAPATRVAQVTSAPAAQLARVFGAYASSSS